MASTIPQRAIKVIYITGTARCGSTLLGRVLGHADGCHAPGELSLLWRRGLLANEVCSCGATFRDCPFWQAVFQRAYGGFDRVDGHSMADFLARVSRSRRLPGLLLESRARPRAAYAPYLEVLSRLYQAIADLSQCNVLVDTSKQPSYALLLASLHNVDLHVLHLVRDSRAVCFSWQRRRLRFETADKSVYMGRRSLANGALTWTRGNLLSELLRLATAKYSRLRYEDFASTPKTVIGEIAAAVDEELSGVPFVDDRTIKLHDSHLVSGNPVRFEQGNLGIRVDDEWRQNFPPKARQVVTAMTLPLLLHYRYVGANGANANRLVRSR